MLNYFLDILTLIVAFQDGAIHVATKVGRGTKLGSCAAPAPA